MIETQKNNCNDLAQIHKKFCQVVICTYYLIIMSTMWWRDTCRSSSASLYILYLDKPMVVIPYVNIGLYCIEQLTPGSLIAWVKRTRKIFAMHGI